MKLLLLLMMMVVVVVLPIFGSRRLQRLPTTWLFGRHTQQQLLGFEYGNEQWRNLFSHTDVSDVGHIRYYGICYNEYATSTRLSMVYADDNILHTLLALL